MATEKTLIEQARELMYQRGQRGLDLARQMMAQQEIPYEPLREAVKYFMDSWEDVLHPALLSLACEAVGRNPQKTTEVAAAIVLLAGGADLHDDVIDESTVKDSKTTVFGKFGKDLTVLTGEVLLFQGLYALHEACQTLPSEQRTAILETAKQAFFAISSAEAEESSIHGRTDVAEEYFEMVKLKAAVSEATMRMGAILGKGTRGAVEALGSCGKTIGVLYTLRDEFIDLYELNELKNRLRKECLPLPALLTMKDPEAAALLKEKFGNNVTQNQLDSILDLVLDSKETKNLKKTMRFMIKKEKENLRANKLSGGAFALLMDALFEGL